MRLAFYGDDFTGSTDALEVLALAGWRTALFLEPPSAARLAEYPGLQAIGVAGRTRSLGPAAMEADLRPAFTALRALGAPHVHYKVCSTFDSSPTVGSIGRAVDVGVEIFRAPFVPLLVGAPALGRYCLFGNLFARMGIGSDGPIYRLDRHPSMSRHPVTPAHESDLRLQLGRQTAKRIGLFDVLQLRLPEADAHAALQSTVEGGAEVVLFDLVYPEQLALIGALIDRWTAPGRPLFSIGSSGLEMALTAHASARGRVPPVGGWPEPEPVGPILVGSGSCSPVTEEQIARAMAGGFAGVALDTAAVAAGDSERAVEHAAGAAVAAFKAGRSVIIHSSLGSADPRLGPTTAALAETGAGGHSGPPPAEVLGRALGRALRAAIERTGARRLVIAGGDTSSYAARALGIEAVEMLAPLTRGAPLCRVRAPGSPADGCEISFKGGQVGAPDFLLRAVCARPVS
jgi:uncharacterized protein YgbK (DUF1537 family)